jgi:hypothetical protein
VKLIRFSVAALTFGWLAASPVGAAELQQIVLDDGSTIIAEVRSLDGGVYRLESPSLGSIEIPQKRVRRIEPQSSSGPASPVSQGSGAHAGEVRDLQLQMAADPAMVATILQLSELPEMLDVLSDPEILRAVESGDLGALEANPKIQKLMSSPAVQDLTGSVSPAE